MSDMKDFMTAYLIDKELKRYKSALEGLSQFFLYDKGGQIVAKVAGWQQAKRLACIDRKVTEAATEEERLNCLRMASSAAEDCLAFAAYLESEERSASDPLDGWELPFTDPLPEPSAEEAFWDTESPNALGGLGSVYCFGEFPPYNMSFDELCSYVQDELEAALGKFPKWPKNPHAALNIVQEEIGEVTQALLDMLYEPEKGVTADDLLKECVQSVAMLARFVYHLADYDLDPRKQGLTTDVTGIF